MNSLNSIDKLELEEGLLHDFTLALFVSLATIPNMIEAKTLSHNIKQVLKSEMKMNSKSVQDAIHTASKTQEKCGGYSKIDVANMLARTIFREGRAETHEGRMAIASVIYTRASGKLDNLASVIKYKNAFSCWNSMTEDDWKNFKYLIPKESTLNETDRKVWLDSVDIASLIMTRKFKSTIGNLNSYYNPDKAKPSWGKKLTNVKTIGNHKFGYLTSEDPLYKNKKTTVAQNPKSFVYHTIKSGDTLSKIAKQYKTTVDKIAKDNNIKDPNKIRIGQKIKV